MTGVVFIGVLFIIVGLLAMMYGQRLFSMFLSIYAFSLTFSIIVNQYGQSMTTLAIALAVAVVAAIVAQYAQRLAFFLLGFVAGLFLGGMVVAMIPEIDTKLWLIVILATGIVLGILSSHFNKTFIRLGTAFLGGKSLATGLLFFIFNITDLNAFAGADFNASMQNTSAYIAESFSLQYSMYILVGSLIFTCIGYYLQSKKKHKRR